MGRVIIYEKTIKEKVEDLEQLERKQRESILLTLALDCIQCHVVRIFAPFPLIS